MNMRVDQTDMTTYLVYLAACSASQQALIVHTLERETGRAQSYNRDLMRKHLADAASLIGFTLTPIAAPAPTESGDPDFNDDITPHDHAAA